VFVNSKSYILGPDNVPKSVHILTLFYTNLVLESLLLTLVDELFQTLVSRVHIATGLLFTCLFVGGVK
jgi:hypothetical protein